MRFTQSELELIGQCTTPDKVLALTELPLKRRNRPCWGMTCTGWNDTSRKPGT